MEDKIKRLKELLDNIEYERTLDKDMRYVIYDRDEQFLKELLEYLEKKWFAKGI